MKKMTTFVCAALTAMLVAVPVFAQKKKANYEYSGTQNNSSSYSYASSTKIDNAKGSMHISGALGFVGIESTYLFIEDKFAGSTGSMSGFVSVGADFEYMMRTNLGAAGIFRYFSTSDTTAKDTETTVSGFGFGAVLRNHIPQDMWDFYFGAGFGLIDPQVEIKAGSTTTKIDPSMKICPLYELGVEYALSHNMAAGVETTRALALGSEMQGWLYSDWVLKFRYTLD